MLLESFFTGYFPASKPGNTEQLLNTLYSTGFWRENWLYLHCIVLDPSLLQLQSVAPVVALRNSYQKLMHFQLKEPETQWFPFHSLKACNFVVIMSQSMYWEVVWIPKGAFWGALLYSGVGQPKLFSFILYCLRVCWSQQCLELEPDFTQEEPSWLPLKGSRKKSRR